MGKKYFTATKITGSEYPSVRKITHALLGRSDGDARAEAFIRKVRSDDMWNENYSYRVWDSAVNYMRNFSRAELRSSAWKQKKRLEDKDFARYIGVLESAETWEEYIEVFIAERLKTANNIRTVHPGKLEVLSWCESEEAAERAKIDYTDTHAYFEISPCVTCLSQRLLAKAVRGTTLDVKNFRSQSALALVESTGAGARIERVDGESFYFSDHSAFVVEQLGGFDLHLGIELAQIEIDRIRESIRNPKRKYLMYHEGFVFNEIFTGEVISRRPYSDTH